MAKYSPFISSTPNMIFRLCLILGLLCSYTPAFPKTPKVATLSPHITELVYSAGAGPLLVGVSAYSNYPEEATQLPVIGDAFAINQELLLQLKPDLVLYWKDNIAKQMVNQVENLGIKTLAIDTLHIADIPKAIQVIADTTGTTPNTAVANFLPRIEALKANAQNKPQLKALIQISDKPIYTVNKNHWMSESLNICGMTNIFADLPLQSTSVNLESIIARNPDVLVRFSPITPNEQLALYPQINAIKNNNIIQVNPDHFSRATLRLLSAIEVLCQPLTSN